MLPSKQLLAQRARRERERNARAPTNILHGSGRRVSNSTPIHTSPSFSFHFGSSTSQNLENFNYQMHNGLTNPTQQPPLSITDGSNKRMKIPRVDSTLIIAPTHQPLPTPSRETYTVDNFCFNDDYHEEPDISSTIITHIRDYLGKMDVLCRNCSALHWDAERLHNSSRRLPLFGMCCLQGKIKLPLLSALPPALQSLFDGDDRLSTSYRGKMHQYNATNAFTSLGAKLDDRVLHGVGPTCFTIHGELRHRIGLLLPSEGAEPAYYQLYIYDSSTTLEARSRRNPDLDPDILKIIQETLQECNPFVSHFRTAHEIMTQSVVGDNNIKAHLHYDPSTDRRRYNLPTSSMEEIAVILPGEGAETNGPRDIIVYLKEGNALMRISECHRAYLPLHYVLFFPKGDLGWTPELKHWDVVNNRFTNKRLTQMDFFGYRLFERPTEYSPILHGHKLFQEFLVDPWASTEQNRLSYQKHNQNKLRVDIFWLSFDVNFV